MLEHAHAERLESSAALAPTWRDARPAFAAARRARKARACGSERLASLGYLEQQPVYGTNENIPRPCLRIRDERLRAVELPESLADKKPHRRSVPQPLRLGRAARHDGGRQALVYWAGISSNRNAALVDS
jgi:hypothetical protein